MSPKALPLLVVATLFASLIQNVSSYAITITLPRHTKLLGRSRPERYLVRIKSIAGDEIHEVNEDTSDDFGQSDEDHPQISKAKWKKKRFLLIQDVKKLIKTKNPHAPKKAEEMVRRMQKLYDKSGGDEEYLPTIQAYNLWIHALAKSNDENAGSLAEDVMEEMIKNHISPTVITYTSVMDAHARSRNPKRAEKMLFRLLDDATSGNEELSSVTCDTILNAWAQQGTTESAERAQMILFSLEEWQRNEIKPTKISYATVMNAWAKVGSVDAAEHAEALLKRMLKTGIVAPDTVVFNAAINAWATSKDITAGERALELLDKMKHLAVDGYDTEPDIVSFNTVLSAWSHCGNPKAAQNAEKIVQGMLNAAKDSSDKPTPNRVSYNTILNAWAKSSQPGSAPRAQKVLDFMMKSTNTDINPDVISFTSVMDAWAKSKEPHKGAKCQQLLLRLESMYKETKREDLKPTHYAYNSVLNACAFSALGTSVEEQREAIQIAVNTFMAMRQSDVSPDTVSYGNMLKCLANLMPQGDMRNKMALQIFDRCVQDGLVGTLVWNEVRRAVPSNLITETYRLKRSAGNLELKELPRQ